MALICCKLSNYFIFVLLVDSAGRQHVLRRCSLRSIAWFFPVRVFLDFILDIHSRTGTFSKGRFLRLPLVWWEARLFASLSGDNRALERPLVKYGAQGDLVGVVAHFYHRLFWCVRFNLLYSMNFVFWSGLILINFKIWQSSLTIINRFHTCLPTQLQVHLFQF